MENVKKYSEKCISMSDVLGVHYEPGDKIKLYQKGEDGEQKTVYWRVVKEYPLFILVDNGLYKTCIDKWSLL